MSYGCRVPPSLSMGASAALRSPEMMRGVLPLAAVWTRWVTADASSVAAVTLWGGWLALETPYMAAYVANEWSMTSIRPEHRCVVLRIPAEKVGWAMARMPPERMRCASGRASLSSRMLRDARAVVGAPYTREWPESDVLAYREHSRTSLTEQWASTRKTRWKTPLLTRVVHAAKRQSSFGQPARL